MRLRKPTCFFLSCFIAFFWPAVIPLSALVQSVVHWIAPVVMSSWPCQSVIHFSFLPRYAAFEPASSFCMPSTIAFSSSPSHISTAPSSTTLPTNAAVSLSGEIMPNASKLRLSCLPGGITSIFEKPSKHL